MLLLLLLATPSTSILFPRDSPTRASKSLDGMWRFKLSPKMDQEVAILCQFHVFWH